MKKWIQTPTGMQEVDSGTNPEDFSPQELSDANFIANVINGYNQAVTDLETIQNTSNPTNAQVVWAVQREAQILEYTIKVLRNIYLRDQ